MSSVLKSAIVQQALDTSNLYLRNAALKHGVPETAFVPRLWSEDKVSVSYHGSDKSTDQGQEGSTSRPARESSASTVTTSTTTEAATPAAPVTPNPSRFSDTAKTAALVGLSLLSGGSLTGLALAPWLASKPAPVSPKEETPKEGLLLPWLEEQGFHQPEAK